MRSPLPILTLLALGAGLALALIAVAGQLDGGRSSDGARSTTPGKSSAAERGGPKALSPRRTREPAPRVRPRIRWRESAAVGTPVAGALEGGVLLPRSGGHFFTWDPIHRRSPSRPRRRWGTDELVRVLLRVARAYRDDHPSAPRVGIGDLSRPRGGDFGPQFGGIGHASHQNGLDADVYYPRLDGAERAPEDAGEIRPGLSQDLVDRFVAAGAEVVYVGPNTGLTGPPGVVVPLVNHDNHLHVRLAP